MSVQLMLAVILSIVSVSSSAWCAPVVKVYISEFSVSGLESPGGMKSTLRTLLLSRLAGEKIASQAKPEGAEITVTGSYLVSGSVFSLDAEAVNSAGAVIARSFIQGKNPDELIPAAGVLAKSLAEGIAKGIASMEKTQTSALPSDIVKPAQIATASGLIVHKLEGELSGIAVGRTLPGGDRELFVVGNQVLRYYRQGAELKLMAEIQYKAYEKVLSVDTADLDNDNLPEIYVTVMSGETLVSQVWTINGASLKQIAGPLPYFFRAVAGAGGVKKLFAQKMTGTADFFGDVVQLVRSGEGYQLGNPVKLPKQGYIYNFNVLKGYKEEANPIVFDRSGYLKVFNPAGDELWKSSEQYSGSETSFKRADRESLSSVDGYRSVFLDQRIVVKANGEVLIPKNSASWFMLSKHSYSNNNLFCFVWSGSNLEEKWHTKQSDYYLADFAYDDSSRELFMLEVVAREEGVFDKGVSRLVIRKVD